MVKRLVLVFIAFLLLTATTANGIAQREHLDTAEPNIHLIASSGQAVVLEFEVPDYDLSFEEKNGIEYHHLTIPGSSHTAEPGKPQVPMVNTLVGVPPDAHLELHVLDDVSEPITGFYKLLPAPSPAPLTEEFQSGEFVYKPDETAYSSENQYPEEMVRITDDAWIRDQRIIRVEFYPFQYYPAQGEILWHKQLRIKIRFLSDQHYANSVTSSIEKSPFENVLKGAIINFESARDWRVRPTSQIHNLEYSTTQAQLAGPRYKIAIDEDGLYRLTGSSLKAAGMDLGSIDPVKFQMTNQGENVALFVENNDGDEHKFSEGEAIIFYGQKFYGDRLAQLYVEEDEHWYKYFQRQMPDGNFEWWAPKFNATMLEKYTDENVYWLSNGEVPGKRMDLVDGTPGVADTPETYRSTAREEQSLIWYTRHFTSEDTWFWDKIETDGIESRTYTSTLSSVASGYFTATLRGEVWAATDSDSDNEHQILFYVNDPDHSNNIIYATWDGKSRYAFEGTLPHSQLINGENEIELIVNQDDTKSSYEIIYFDWFEVEYDRYFTADNNKIIFTNDLDGEWMYEVDGFTGIDDSGDIWVLDITNPMTPTRVVSNTLESSTTTSFQLDHEAGAIFFVGEYQDIPNDRISFYNPPEFDIPAEYVFITPKTFASTIDTLSEYRASQGLSTAIVDIEDLYNQFNYGIYHPIAIKNFLSYTFSNWDYPPIYVLLVGDGHWNFKGNPSYDSPPNFMPPNLVWVDPWQGEVDSANLLATVVGDDPVPDLHIARMPVNSVLELEAAIAKIITFEGYNSASWQRRLLFIADNQPDPRGAGDFVDLSEAIIEDYSYTGYQFDRIYENDFGCTDSQYCPVVNYAITTTMNTTGTMIANYIGHAALNRWSNESIFVNADISTLSNSDRLPIILSMTCWDGYWIHPDGSAQSLMEEIVRTPNKGAVSTFSPTGLGVASGHDYLHRGFYDSLFVDDIWELGYATYAAKLNLYATGSNYDLLHTFTIFGDPALNIIKTEMIYLPNIMK